MREMAPPIAAKEDEYILNRDWRAMERSVIDPPTHRSIRNGYGKLTKLMV